MKTGILHTINPSVLLIEPNLERDASLGVKWINCPEGYKTLQLMGVADKDNKRTTLEQEKRRVQEFIKDPKQLNWMISLDSKVVGAVWVNLYDTDCLKSPSIHIMIGDTNIRGKGIGTATVRSVLDYLKQQGYKIVYSRYLLINNGSKKLLTNIGFNNDGNTYEDNDKLVWQNVKISLNISA
jgi:RimJ/RimL family protein N-acetyltransferase